MQNSLAVFLNRIIFLGLLLTAFAIPLFFVPLTSEFYEFNKQILLYVLVLAMLLAWTFRMIVEKQVRITRTPLDLPLIFFLIIYFLASIFSQDQFVSFAGSYGRWNHGFFSVLTYVLLYFIAVSNLNERKHVISVLIALVFSTSIAALVNILYYFGLFILPYSWAQNRSFTTLGSPNDLAVLEAMVLPLILGLFLNTKNPTLNLLSLISFAIVAVSFSLTNLLGAWIALGIGLLVLVLYLSKEKQTGPSYKFLLPAVIFVLALLSFFLPWSKQNLITPAIQNKPAQVPLSQIAELPKEPILPVWASWSVATASITNWPILGSGPGTYLYDFTRFKSPRLNLTELWDLRFDRPSAEIFEFLSTTGILGTLSYLLIFILAGFLIVKIFTETSLSQNSLAVGVVLSLSVFGFGNLFFPVSTASFVAFILVLATLMVEGKELGIGKISEVLLKIVALQKGALKAIPTSETKESSAFLSWILFLPSLALAIFGGFLIFKAYSAEVYYRNALVALSQNRAGTAFDNLRFAVQSNPYRDVYHRAASQASFAIAQALSQRENLSDQERQNLSQLVIIAINEGKIASGYQQRPQSGTSPLNVQNWETLGAVYRGLIGPVQGADAHTLNTYAQAVILDPANARLHEAFGLVLLAANRLDDAQRAFEQAVIVNPNYPSGHYNLASVLRQKGGNEQRIFDELTITLRLLPQNDPNRGQIEQELSEAKKKLEEFRAKQPIQAPPPQTPPAEATPETTPSAQ